MSKLKSFCFKVLPFIVGLILACLLMLLGVYGALAAYDRLDSAYAADDEIYNFNQFIQNGDFSNGTTNWSGTGGTISSNGNALTYTVSSAPTGPNSNRLNYISVSFLANHQYAFIFTCKGVDTYRFMLAISGGPSSTFSVDSSSTTYYVVLTPTSSLNAFFYLSFRGDLNSFAVGDTFTVSNFMLVDLTQCFNTGNEPSSLVAFQSVFPSMYYQYTTSTLISTSYQSGYDVGFADGVVQGQSYFMDYFSNFGNLYISTFSVNSNFYYWDDSVDPSFSFGWANSLRVNSFYDLAYMNLDFKLYAPLVVHDVGSFIYLGPVLLSFSRPQLLYDSEQISFDLYYYADENSSFDLAYLGHIVIGKLNTFLYLDPYDSSQYGKVWFNFFDLSPYYNWQGRKTFSEQSAVDTLVSSAIEAAKNRLDTSSISYITGYNRGFAAAENPITFTNLMTSVLDVPLKTFNGLFNFDFLGINLKAFLLSLFTLGLIIAIVRLCLGGK